MKFIKEKKDFTKIAVVLALGLILIFIGGISKEESTVTELGVEDRLAEVFAGVEGVVGVVGVVAVIRGSSVVGIVAVIGRLLG